MNLHRAKMVMEEATLLMKINKNKNTARAIAKEKMIDEFLNKVATLFWIDSVMRFSNLFSYEKNFCGKYIIFFIYLGSKLL
jgi:hypothetical protein